jgi:hypothetical protein
MIDVVEYNRWRLIEEKFKNIDTRMIINGQLRYVPECCGPLNLPMAKVEKYDYFVSQSLGVVKALNDTGTLIDKSPVCEQMDKDLFGV